eukprot:gene297-170_t
MGQLYYRIYCVSIDIDTHYYSYYIFEVKNDAEKYISPLRKENIVHYIYDKVWLHIITVSKSSSTYMQHDSIISHYYQFVRKKRFFPIIIYYINIKKNKTLVITNNNNVNNINTKIENKKNETIETTIALSTSGEAILCAAPPRGREAFPAFFPVPCCNGDFPVAIIPRVASNSKCDFPFRYVSTLSTLKNRLSALGDINLFISIFFHMKLIVNTCGIRKCSAFLDPLPFRCKMFTVTYTDIHFLDLCEIQITCTLRNKAVSYFIRK